MPKKESEERMARSLCFRLRWRGEEGKDGEVRTARKGITSYNGLG